MAKRPPRFEALPGYAWDTRTKRFHRISTGQIVSADTMRALLVTIHDASADRFALLAQDAIEGRIGAAHFQEAMMVELRHLYNASAALAVGGFDRMTAQEYGRNGQVLRGEYRYLAGFAQDIADGKLTILQAEARARLYAGKAYSRYWAEYTRTMQAGGATREKWVTAADERVCRTTGQGQGCEELGKLGWVPLGLLPSPGDGTTVCLGACRCHKEYR